MRLMLAGVEQTLLFLRGEAVVSRLSELVEDAIHFVGAGFAAGVVVVFLPSACSGAYLHPRFTGSGGEQRGRPVDAQVYPADQVGSLGKSCGKPQARQGSSQVGDVPACIGRTDKQQVGANHYPCQVFQANGSEEEEAYGVIGLTVGGGGHDGEHRGGGTQQERVVREAKYGKML